MALKPAEPQAVVIFGASGDLTRRKLLPAFWHLFLEGLLPEGIAVVGAARTEMSDDQWRDYARDQVKRFAREEPSHFMLAILASFTAAFAEHALFPRDGGAAFPQTFGHWSSRS